MARADRHDPLSAQDGNSGPPHGQGVGDGSRALQLDMFGAPPQPICGADLEGMRAELKEILGVEPVACEASEDDAAQLRLEFLRAELARIDSA